MPEYGSIGMKAAAVSLFRSLPPARTETSPLPTPVARDSDFTTSGPRYEMSLNTPPFCEFKDVSFH